MKVDITYYSATGGRTCNEDTVSVLESGKSVLALVADGLGGHGGGDAASRCAVSSVNGMLQNSPVSKEKLCAAIAEANRNVTGMQDEGIKMMSTIAAVWLTDYTVAVANVGDSRIYQIRHDEIIYQSVDHSVAQMAVYVGEITAEQIRGHRDRNKLVRAIGSKKTVKIDSKVISTEPGDFFLLCTDGFWEQITEELMLQMLHTSSDITTWMNKMRSYVEANGGSDMDNHSAVALKVH